MSGKSATYVLNRTHFISNVYIVHGLQTLIYTCISFNTRDKSRKSEINQCGQSKLQFKVTLK